MRSIKITDRAHRLLSLAKLDGDGDIGEHASRIIEEKLNMRIVASVEKDTLYEV